jgi:hypothetical protein
MAEEKNIFTTPGQGSKNVFSKDLKTQVSVQPSTDAAKNADWLKKNFFQK